MPAKGRSGNKDEEEAGREAGESGGASMGTGDLACGKDR